MIHTRTRGLRSLFLLAQSALASAVYWLWLPVTQRYFDVISLPLEKYLYYNTALVLGIAVGYLTQPDKYHFSSRSFRVSNSNALWQQFFSFGFLLVYLVGSQDNSVSRGFIFSLAPILYATLLVTQRYLPAALVRASFGAAYELRVALVGPAGKALSLRPWLNEKSGIGYKLVGLICDDPQSLPVPGFKVLGGLEDLERAIRTWDISQIILVEIPQRDEELRQCTAVCEKWGVRLLAVCNFEERFGHSMTLFEDGSLRFVGLREEPLENPMNRLCKRALDLAVAAPAALCVLPVATLFVWLLHRWQSPGPTFFLQQRSGLQNRPFRMIKYRTLSIANDDETRQVKQDDPRLFPAGRWLRRFSVDELPQFLNVLSGEMSLVGPRPHLPKHNELFARAMQNYHVRAGVRPGITGLAQVRGFRGGTFCDRDIANRVDSDIDYLENWSFSLDCSILLRTLSQMIFPPKGAY